MDEIRHKEILAQHDLVRHQAAEVAEALGRVSRGEVENWAQDAAWLRRGLASLYDEMGYLQACLGGQDG